MCISITIYKGYQCTEKFIANPTTINDEVLGKDDIPPIQWSMCQKFTITEDIQCLYLDSVNSLFSQGISIHMILFK